MIYSPRIYTVESVSPGHPDKVCDQVSDAVLDACLQQDPSSRVAVESFGSHGLLVIGGEVTTRAQFDARQIAERVYRNIGYEEELEIITRIFKQSPDIAQGVDTGGAGDQGIMYGYATDETPEFMPLGTGLSHCLLQNLEGLRRSGEIPWLRPDSKSQVTIEGGEIKTILISTQHDEETDQEEIRKILTEKLIKPLIGDVSGVETLINPTGKFFLGGFAADTGLTGRKIMVDTYGGLIQHGGGAFSGKDATKVDRSAAYMCRFAAKSVVAGGLAKKCLVSTAYAIGRAEPLMVEAIDENGKDISKAVKENFDFRPSAIIERLGLRRPIFEKTAAYGHFGREEFPWEKPAKL